MKLSTLLHSHRQWAALAIAAGAPFAMLRATPQADPSGSQETAEYVQLDLESDQQLKAAHIEIQVSKHLATLSGDARTLAQAERAVARAIASSGVDAVVNLVEIRQTGDSQIEERAKTILVKQKMLDASDIALEIKGGRVTLSGSVGTPDERELARDLMTEVSGVVAVDNRLAVTFVGTRTDSQIANQIRYTVSRDPLYLGLDLGITVNDGTVAINGEVGSLGEVDRLARRSYVTGVMQVSTKRLSVNTDLAMDAVGDKNYTDEQALVALQTVFAADPRIAGSAIQPEVAQGVVTLRGQAADLAASDAAESGARGIPGVLQIANELSIGSRMTAEFQAASPPLLRPGR